MDRSIKNFKETLKPYYKSLRQRVISLRRDWYKSSPDPRESEEYKMRYIELKIELRKIWNEVNKDIKMSEDEIDAIVTDEAVNLMKIYWHNRILPDSNFTPYKVGEIIKREIKLMHEMGLNAGAGLRGGKRKTAKSNTKNVVKKSKNVNNAKKPAAKKPVAKKPATKKPVAKKPAAKKPVAKKPVAKKSATSKSKSKK
jgi:hypothetical protein